jgi:hypothetical protein
MEVDRTMIFTRRISTDTSQSLPHLKATNSDFPQKYGANMKVELT